MCGSDGEGGLGLLNLGPGVLAATTVIHFFIFYSFCDMTWMNE